jgi:hypothetical protein
MAGIWDALPASALPTQPFIPPPQSPGELPVQTQSALLNLLKALAGPALDAGNYLGGLMEGTEPFRPSEALGHGVDLAMALAGPKFLPKGAGELAMDTASRMARAKEMGFRTSMPLYHGTNAEFSAFRAAPTIAEELAAPGVSTALDPAVASEFAASRAATRGGQAQVLPLYHRADNPVRLDLSGRESHAQVVETLRDAFERGHDSVMITNYTTPGGLTGQKIIIVRDPEQLRSVNAAFDPAKRNSANLLAGLAGAAAIPLSSLAIPPQQPPKFPGL